MGCPYRVAEHYDEAKHTQNGGAVIKHILNFGWKTSDNGCETRD